MSDTTLKVEIVETPTGKANTYFTITEHGQERTVMTTHKSIDDALMNVETAAMLTGASDYIIRVSRTPRGEQA